MSREAARCVAVPRPVGLEVRRAVRGRVVLGGHGQVVGGARRRAARRAAQEGGGGGGGVLGREEASAGERPGERHRGRRRLSGARVNDLANQLAA